MHILHTRTGLYILSYALLIPTHIRGDPIEVVVTADGRALPGEAAYGTPKEAASDPALRKEPEPVRENEALSVAQQLFNAVKGATDTGPSNPPLPKEKIVRVISDIHAGSCWFRDKVNQRKVMQLFESMAAGSENQKLDALVLNGDIIDLALENLGTQPKCPSEMLMSDNVQGFNVRGFNNLIRRISHHIPTYYVNGNHDVNMDKKMVHEAWGDKVHYMGNDFSMHGICFTHGHLQDVTSHSQEGSGLEALAYYVSRATTTPKGGSCEFGKGFAMRPGWQVHAAENFWGVAMNQLHGKVGEDAISFLSKHENYEKFAVGLLAGALKLVKQDKAELAKFKVAGADRHGSHCDRHGVSDNYTLADVVDDHKYDLERAVEKHGKNHSLKMFRASMMDFAAWTQTQCQNDCKAQLLGHSHVPELKKLPCTYYQQRDKTNPYSRQKDILYGNSGAWTYGPFEQRLSSYIDITVSCEAADAQFTEFEKPGVRRETLANAQICEPTRLDLFQYQLDRDAELLESVSSHDSADGANPLSDAVGRLKTLVSSAVKVGEDA